MLELDKLLWVVPGVIFIHIYNKRRPINSINLSGWSYLFSLVMVAVFTWLPIEIFLKDKIDILGKWQILVVPFVSGLLSFCIALLFTLNKSINWRSGPYFISSLIVSTVIWLLIKIVHQSDWNFFGKWCELLILLASSLLLFISPLFFIKFSNIIFFNVHDIFFTNCIQWEGKPIILNLRNDKIYIGILLKYPENPQSRYESQTISIIPLISGGRNKNTKEVVWNTFYPEDDLYNYEIVIPRNEIITFGKFNKNIFNHFYKDSRTNKDFNQA